MYLLFIKTSFRCETILCEAEMKINVIITVKIFLRHIEWLRMNIKINIQTNLSFEVLTFFCVLLIFLASYKKFLVHQLNVWKKKLLKRFVTIITIPIKYGIRSEISGSRLTAANRSLNPNDPIKIAAKLNNCFKNTAWQDKNNNFDLQELRRDAKKKKILKIINPKLPLRWNAVIFIQ